MLKNHFTGLVLLAMFGLILVFSGCYPDNSITYDQSDIVWTNYDDQVDFSTISTYAIRDTIAHLTEKDEEPDRTYDQQILDDINRNMEAYGYQRITDTTQAVDVALTVSVIEIQNIQIWSYGGGYPCWGCGWGYPGWGWGGGWYYPPYYPPYTSVSSYTTGTILIDMLDPNNAEVIEGDTLVPVYWSAVVNGILQSNQNEVSRRISKTIDQAFTQSPYLSNN